MFHPNEAWKGTIIGFLATSIALVAQINLPRSTMLIVVGCLVMYAALLVGWRVLAHRIVSGPHEGVCGCLKTWPEFFDAVLSGRKKFELRKNDRDFQPGHIWCLNEFRPEADHPEGGVYTGRWIKVRITYIVRGPVWGLASGWAIWGFDLISRGENHVS